MTVEALKPIVVVEDNPNDLELTLTAVEKARLANEVIVLRDRAGGWSTCCVKGAGLNEKGGTRRSSCRILRRRS